MPSSTWRRVFGNVYTFYTFPRLVIRIPGEVTKQFVTYNVTPRVVLG